ncbi:regulator of cell morphogenesis and NO signaling [Winogradskyella epiphytica]|uniref:Regulator of cell morphogenesis and NO signaling n=1 Tax=Winogradskyella epiphytica TaxID=262005 RepID=A0A2V4X6X6_9FLAO|nr:iron-sulfur cluster repair di-iron protein [Winogradskyella epiphytica]PYE81059.1 regulator of cell morphogenesis and NO signaling [Winogradskyella epiphytica]GGW66560.1 iron-sulfur cluster repair di-iron protein [Winogradskyella epiphytica]
METLQMNSQKEIGQYVADDFRTAAIFSKYKIDFCCNGNRTVEEACKKKGIDSSQVLEELHQVINSKTGESIDYKSWPIDLLAEYIEKKHHRYVEEKTPVLRQFLDKLCKVHGERHPELFKIKDLFYASTGELASHMKKEELILFPFVKRMVKAKLANSPVQSPQFGTVENPIAMMMEEHDNEGQRFREIAELTDNYTPPSDACNTYKVTYAMLDEFEKDLHLHIHLENNILFPEAIKLEKQISY